MAVTAREESLQKELRDLREEKENFLKRIQDLSKSAEQQKTSKGMFSVTDLPLTMKAIKVTRTSQSRLANPKIDHRKSLPSFSPEVICRAIW